MRPAHAIAKTHAPPGLFLLACLMLCAAGCTLSPRQQDSGPPLTLTEHVAPSALLAVIPGPTAGQALAGLASATARPEEDMDILQAGATAKVLLAADSPPPARVIIPGKPAAPSSGATSYQQASYHERLKQWHSEDVAGQQAVGARTNAAISRWASALGIPRRVSGTFTVAGDPASLADECATAASALAGLEEAAGDSFGSHRVILLYAPNLGGIPAAGELIGDDVIVVTPFLPSAAAASTAQADLIDAGATRASVLGPESTAAQLAQLVTAGLSQNVITETLSGTALFANDSAALLPGAVRVLTPLLLQLHRAGATAVVNGYASTPGNSTANYRLSYARAAAVASFLEARGIPASSFIIVGHGANDLVAAGPSGANRRVIVVIEEPSNNKS